MDCSPPASSVRGILQARVLEWGAISFSMGSSPPRDQTQVSLIAGRPFPNWATREASLKNNLVFKKKATEGYISLGTADTFLQFLPTLVTFKKDGGGGGGFNLLSRFYKYDSWAQEFRQATLSLLEAVCTLHYL